MTNSEIRDTIQTIVDRWFLSEPLLFAAYCAHKLAPNSSMQCAFRSGQRRIEYNPEWLAGFNELEIGELLRREVIRIILKHPYERQPINAISEILFVASNVTIYQHRGTSIAPNLWMSVNLPEGLSFEEYYNLLSHQLPPQPPIGGCGEGSSDDKDSTDGDNSSSGSGASSGDNHEDKNEQNSDGDSTDTESSFESSENGIAGQRGGKSSDRPQSLSKLIENGVDGSELWSENEVQIEYINGLIENAMLTDQWGSMPSNLKDFIKASTVKSENIRRRLDMFRTSIISTNRQLTRMRPSRRYGWVQMGVRHPYTSRLLIAVDTSGSIQGEDLERFFGVVNSFFTYGIPHIDVIQFDAALHFPLLSLDKVTKKIELRGGGGTNFQPAVNYFDEHKEYDGMLVFTDGYAPDPKVPSNRKILWVLKNIQCYKDCTLEPKVYI
ncbi:MAG: hypothetical protein HDS46_06530 [Bacteroides sp.]|nr:hypothetical protein [Bacteroides sp.]